MYNGENMPKKPKLPATGYRVEAYSEKQLRIRAAQLAPFIGPEHAYYEAKKVVDKMTEKFAYRFGAIREEYDGVVKAILDRHGKRGPERAKYHSFYLAIKSKVVTGKATVDELFNRWINFYECDPAILDEILRAIGIPREVKQTPT